MFKRITLNRLHFNINKAIVNASPPTILVFGYFVLVLIGTLLLKLPIATISAIDWLQALFTATSAVTVTGLVVVDTGVRFTVFGQVIIVVLIQTGGLGFMTFSILTAISLGKKLGIKHQLLALEALNQTSLNKIWDVARAVFNFSIIIESIGFILLALIWYPSLGWTQALYEAFFYTVSAFNNAGFALRGDSLTPFVGHVPINLVITFLFIIGGLGFVVLMDIWEQRSWRKLQPYTKAILISSVLINLISWLLIWLFERNNPETLAHLPLATQVTAAWFQAVTPRTAGFNTLAIDSLTDSSILLTIMLMFIGGGSFSTASGIKLGTFVVLLMATYAFLRRLDEVTLLRRSIPQFVVMKAFAITTISLMLVFIGTLILSVSETAPFLDVLFEVVSALGTVGLSRGITGQLSGFGQLAIIVLMFIGRLGPLTMAYFISTPKQRRLRYPSMDIQVG